MAVRTAGNTVGRIALLVCLVMTALVSTPAERLAIKTYTTADGLARDHVNRIVQDSRGFLWFCTTEGLSRFDGYRFTNYGTEEGLAGRVVSDFLETRSGIYWVATNKGLCRFNPDPPQQSAGGAHDSFQRFVAYYPSEETNARAINVIYEDHAGTVWCGTEQGLFRLDRINDQWIFAFVDIIRPARPDLQPAVRAILEDRSRSLWVSSESGLHRRRPDGTVERYASKEGLPVNAVASALLEGQDGRIWVGTTHGLYRLVADPEPNRSIVARLYTKRDGLSDNRINSLCQSSDGKLWVGTGTGLDEFIPEKNRDGGGFRSYSTVNGLSDATITALAEDRSGNLWIGTAWGGAMRLAANRFTTYSQADGLGGVGIGVILADRNGRLIVGDGEGHLNGFERTRFTAARLVLPKGMTYWGWGWYQTIIQSRTGEWWMATGQGLVRYPILTRIEQITHAPPRAVYTTRDGLPANEMFRVFEDSRGDIWISTIGNPAGVLTRWEPATETFHSYTPADGIPESAPTAFCEDASGNLWMGFYLGGLLRYSAGRFTPYTNADGVPPGLVRGLYLDHAGRLWVATGEGGVARADDPSAEHPRFVTYSTADGLSSNQATCVTEDKWGMIYIGTGRGVDKLDPATGRIKHYTTADGLASSFVNVAFRYSDGSLWFGTLQGVSRLIPQPERPTSPPQILISAVRVAGVAYPVSELGAVNIAGPELRASENHIQIDCLGLSPAVGETLRYQFKLEGVDKDWNVPTDQRTVNYPNLPPGSYRFLARAVSADGTLSESPAKVSFRVLQPIWQRWWFQLLVLVVIAVPIVAVARYRHLRMKAVREAEEALRRSREERLVELEQVRRRIATDLHDDIGSTLSQIYLLSEVVRQRVDRDPSEVAEPLKMISSASHEAVSSMSDIVWAINPRKDHLSDLVQRMRRFASDTFAARDIAFRFRAPDAEVDVRLGANIRREVFLIFKESVNNVVKHSDCTQADIEFQMADASLLLKVSDNGRGFSTVKDSDGHGMASMRERAGSLGGQLDVVSKEGAGTTVTLRVQLTQPPASTLVTSGAGDGAG